jgi:streptogramin lyase
VRSDPEKWVPSNIGFGSICEIAYSIGRYKPSDGTWQRFAPPGGLPDPPVEIAFSGDGAVWFTMRRQTGNPGLGRLNPTTGLFDLWINPYAGIFNPFGITVMGGEVWFMDHSANLLVRFNPASSTFTTYSTLPDIRDAHFLLSDPQGNLWTAGYVSATIGRFKPSSGEFAHVHLSNLLSHPMGIARSPAGDIWCAETFDAGTGGIARFTPVVIQNVPVLTPWPMVLVVVLIGAGGLRYLLQGRSKKLCRRPDGWG